MRLSRFAPAGRQFRPASHVGGERAALYPVLLVVGRSTATIGAIYHRIGLCKIALTALTTPRHGAELPHRSARWAIQGVGGGELYNPETVLPWPSWRCPRITGSSAVST